MVPPAVMLPAGSEIVGGVWSCGACWWHYHLWTRVASLRERYWAIHRGSGLCYKCGYKRVPRFPILTACHMRSAVAMDHQWSVVTAMVISNALCRRASSRRWWVAAGTRWRWGNVLRRQTPAQNICYKLWLLMSWSISRRWEL